MNPPAKTFPWTIGIGLLMLLLALSLVFLLADAKSRGALSSRPLPVYGQVADFALTNQDDKAVSLADLKGHTWIADVIFTRCAGPCPIMTRQMKSLQDALPATSDAKLVTMTTDPGYDTPEILKRYGDRFGADYNRWIFLTGAKPQIAGLAVGSLKFNALPIKSADQKDAVDLFVHSTIFVVVDKHAQLRGVYQTVGEDVDWAKSRQKILAAVKKLEQAP
jgi:protein SCO1/2